MSASNSVLELRLLARSKSEVSKIFSSPVLGNEVRFSNTLPFLTLIKSSSFACLASSIALSIYVTVILAVVIVSGPVLLCVFPGEFWGEFELSRSLISFCLPRLNVLFLTVVLSICSGVIGLLRSGGGVSGSLFDSIMYTFFLF